MLIGVILKVCTSVVLSGMTRPAITYHPFVFLIIATVYLLTRNPYVDFGDSIGFLYHASKDFDLATNATSHFLYNNFNHVLVILTPFLNPVLTLSMVPVIFSLLTLERLHRIARILTEDHPSSILAVLIMAFGFTWWRQTVIIEVYSFYLFLISQAVLCATRDISEGGNSRILQTALWLGLATLTHIQTLLMGPFFLYYAYVAAQGEFLPVVKGLGLWGLISSLLVVLPLFHHLHPVSAVFFDNHFQQEVLSVAWPSLIKGTLRSIGYWLYNFHVFGLLMVHGLWLGWKYHRKLTILYLLGGIPVWLFAMRYDVTDNYVFFLTPYLFMTALSSLSIRFWWGKIHLKWLKPATLVLFVSLSPAVYFFVWKTAEKVPSMQALGESKAYKGGLAYYLWPGRSGSPDPLTLAREIYHQERLPIEEFDRYPVAIEYLKLRHELDSK